MGLITGVLKQGMQAGELREQPIEPLAHLLLGALGEAGLLIASGVPRAHVRAPLLALLEGLLGAVGERGALVLSGHRLAE